MSTPPSIVAIFAFNRNNQLAVRHLGSKNGLPFTGADLAMAKTRLAGAFAAALEPIDQFTKEACGRSYHVYFTQASGASKDPEVEFISIDALRSRPESLAPSLAALLVSIDPFLIDVPYLHLGENDFIYKFRPDKERNRAIYELDTAASGLYQSKLCASIKALARTHERTADAPISLNFGPVEYVIPSHFGFCLGVKNAIERAYETLAENPSRRVFMLSELIHNPFVNADLLRRGLRYLQTDKGVAYCTDGTKSQGLPGEVTLWDTLVPDDIVIIPAFGATNEDKLKLVQKGIPVYQYDATCMLVEKVWKASRSFGREGYTVVIHGKHEHEETKATFSNARRHGPALIVRNLDEARRLGRIILSDNPAERAAEWTEFAGRHTPGFEPCRDLQRIAVVNQTTLLMNETLEIIEHLQSVFARKYGAGEASARVGGSGKRDTLCYATQVNQDALSRALARPLDAAFVIGGKNSSNTYQLYRICEQSLGKAAYFIQSEANIRLDGTVEHFVFPGRPTPSAPASGGIEQHMLNIARRPTRILLTGGASCPDGIIQQVITRINQLYPANELRSVDDVLKDLGGTE